MFQNNKWGVLSSGPNTFEVVSIEEGEALKFGGI
jgi:hypothetical protein